MPIANNLSSRRLGELTTSEIRELPKDETLLVLPIGAVEQHGPHLPCNTDTLLIEAIVAAALASLPQDTCVWVLPALAYGRSIEHLGYPGTMSLSTESLLAVLRDIAGSLARSGFRKLALVNGHGGQVQLLEVAARDLRAETGLLVFPMFPYRAELPQGLVLPHGDRPPDIHAGWVETSLMLSVAPSLVRLESLERDGDRAATAYSRSERLTLEGSYPTAWLTADFSASGVIGDPRGASADVGARILEHLGAELALLLQDASRFEFTASG